MTDSRAPETVSLNDCEVVKWHTRQKHAFIEQYLTVWTERVGRSDRSTIPSLSIIDLFAGFGWCRADASQEPGAPTGPWPGSAVLAARALLRYPRPSKLVLNSFNPESSIETRHQQEALRRAVEAETGSTARFSVDYLSTDVRIAAEESISRVDLRFPTIWILDPYSPEGLPWDVVEGIAGQKREYPLANRIGFGSRRPELIITLMTEGLQRNVDKSPRGIETALGLPESTWRPEMDTLRDGGLNIRESLEAQFCERLDEIYRKPTTLVEVTGSGGNIVYAIVFASSHNAGAYMARMRVAPAFQKWRMRDWKPTAELISMNRRARRRSTGPPTLQLSMDAFSPDSSGPPG